MKDLIIADYTKNKKVYHAFRERMLNLLTDLLAVQNIKIHQITGRTKTLESLSKKIDDKNGKYKIVRDITDITGIRIISYLENDVDSIANLIEKEFIKDPINSIDKRILKADQFGYRSLHMVVSLSEDRQKLEEYKQYKEFKCEIQIRSILQHAWAEIEHGLGYKGEISIPDQYKRTFNRLSALLETADIEFDRLKRDLTIYEKDVKSLIKTSPELVDINKASITLLIKTNPTLQKAQKIIVKKTGRELVDIEISNITFNRINFYNYKNIAEIEKDLNNYQVNFLSFLNILASTYKIGQQAATVAPLLIFLDYLTIKKESIVELDKYYKNIGVMNITNESYQERIDVYKRIFNN